MTTEAASVGAGLSIGYEPHRAQAMVHASPARFRVVVKGRQSGGTLLAVVEITQYAMSHPRAQLYWVTSALSLKSRAWRALAQVIPAKLIRRKSEVDLSIELKNGSRIQIRSADSPDTQLLSESLDGVVLDEFCSYPNDRVWTQYVRPMLAVSNGWALFIGSPRGMNWAHALFTFAASGQSPDWAAFRWPSTASPYFTKDEWMRAKVEMPERVFSQEIEANFLTDGGEIFRRVDDAVRPAAQADTFTVLGIDCALTHDYFVIWACNSRGEWVAFDRFRRVEWPIAKVRIVALYQRLQCVRALIDTTGMNIGESAIATDLQREGVSCWPITITGPLKRGLVENAMLRFEQSALSIPADPVVVDEFKSFTSETLPSGAERFSAPAERFDDIVIACCLALWGIRQFYGRADEPPPLEENDFQRSIRHELEEADGSRDKRWEERW